MVTPRPHRGAMCPSGRPCSVARRGTMLRMLSLTRTLQPLTGPLACRPALTLSPCSSRGCESATAAAVPARPAAKPWCPSHPHLARPDGSSTATAATLRRAVAAAPGACTTAGCCHTPAGLLCGSSPIPQQRLRPVLSTRTDSSPELQQPGGAERGGSSYSSRAFPQQARVGIGVVVFRASPASPSTTQVLLVKRGREPSKGMWSYPGGSLELGETMVECAVREVLEETGIRVRCQLKGAAPSAWSSVLDHPTAFAAADCIEHEDGPGSRIKFHYCIVEMAALAEDPSAEPKSGDDADEAVWMDVQQLAGLESLTEGCDRLTLEAMRVFDVPKLLAERRKG